MVGGDRGTSDVGADVAGADDSYGCHISGNVEWWGLIPCGLLAGGESVHGHEVLGGERVGAVQVLPGVSIGTTGAHRRFADQQSRRKIVAIFPVHTVNPALQNTQRCQLFSSPMSIDLWTSLCMCS